MIADIIPGIAEDQAKEEIQAGYKPVLRSRLDHIQSYDTILVGSPNWWGTIAPPVATFLSGYDLSGKTIVPFCPQSNVLSSFEIYGSGGMDAQARVRAWLSKVGITP